MVASIYDIPPFLSIDKGKDQAYGIVIDIMNILASHQKFNYEKIVADDWMALYPNGSIGGAMGLVGIH